MNRRQVLALLGSATVGGCLGESSGDPEPSTRTTTASRRTTATAGTTTRETDTETTSPEETGSPTVDPPELGEPLPSECPIEDEHVQRVVCYPGADAPLTMTPSDGSVSLPRGTISFVLANETDATFVTNYYAWSLHKRVDGEWYHVAPGAVPVPAYHLSPGESHVWTVTVDNSTLHEEVVTVSDTTDLHLRGLGGGTYAFGIDGWFEGQEYTNKTAAVTRFEVDGDAISLSPTDSVESVEREGGGETAVVRMPETENPRQVTVTRADDPPEEPERVVAEQVIRTTPLRNALAVFEAEGEGVRTVRVENATLMANFTLSFDGKYVAYRGTTYRIESERRETMD